MAAAAQERKTIFITGAASGIGRAVAHHFAARGWFAGLADINEAGLAETASAMPAGSHMSIRLDVRSREDWAKALAAFGEESGARMHVLFNNAGIARVGPFESIAPEEADAIIDVNFRGVLNGIYCALELLKATPGARIINLCSASGLYGSPSFAVYSATKFAVRALTEALDIEFERHGVRVVSLMPWFIETPLLDVGVSDSNVNAREELGRMGLPVYPVSMVAERAWDAAHGRDMHYLVGDATKGLAFAARFAPGLVKARFRKMIARS